VALAGDNAAWIDALVVSLQLRYVVSLGGLLNKLLLALAVLGLHLLAVLFLQRGLIC
jgi:hypothetical protein